MLQKEKPKLPTKVFYWIAGILSFLVGLLFLFLPVLPALPFFGLAAFLLSIVSRRVQRILDSTPHVRKWLAVLSLPQDRKRLGILLIGLIAVVLLVIEIYWVIYWVS